jgi:glutaconate CoA-transferase, subunit B
MFAYWLQGGRISVGFLGGAQIDRFANINSTVIGDYAHPKVRLPGAGGAPEIASACGQIFVIMRQGRRSFVPKVDFITSFGHGEGGDHRQRLGMRTAGPTLVATDLCLMRPDPETRELTVVSIHPGVGREQITEATGWPVRFAEKVEQTHPPTPVELEVLRDLQARTARAHGTATEHDAAG